MWSGEVRVELNMTDDRVSITGVANGVGVEDGMGLRRQRQRRRGSDKVGTGWSVRGW